MSDRNTLGKIFSHIVYTASIVPQGAAPLTQPPHPMERTN